MKRGEDVLVFFGAGASSGIGVQARRSVRVGEGHEHGAHADLPSRVRLGSACPIAAA